MPSTPAPLYLDEDVPVVVAAILRGRGFDVTTTREAGQLGRTDQEQLDFAANADRVLCTHNRIDFGRLHAEWLAAERRHAGIIIARRRRPGEIVTRVGRRLNRLSAEDLKDQLLYCGRGADRLVGPPRKIGGIHARFAVGRSRKVPECRNPVDRTRWARIIPSPKGGAPILEIVMLHALNGLVWGLITALIALGLSIIFGLLDIINVAHGELFMLGAVLAWYVLRYTGSFWLALLLAPLAVAGLGIVIERLVLRTIEEHAVRSIVATFGLGLILQESVRATFGATPQRIMPPIETTIAIFGFHYSVYRIFAAGVALAAIIALFLYLHRTKFGTWMRAVRQDREMAIAMGIPAHLVFMATFALGAGLAALGGVVAAPITTVEFRIGLAVLPTTFIAVVIGGLGNLPGTAVAAVLLGEVEGIASAFVTPTTARMFSLLVMSAVLLLRPEGLFTRRVR